MPILIREAKSEDALYIRHIQHITWLATYVNFLLNILPEDIEAKNFESTENIEKTANWIRTSEASKTYIAELDNKVVGFCTVTLGETENYQGGTYVLPEYQGKGIGKMLFKKAYTHLGTSKPITCEVATYNESAIAFWKKQGFVKTGESKLKLPTGKEIPLYKMTKTYE